MLLSSDCYKKTFNFLTVEKQKILWKIVRGVTSPPVVLVKSVILMEGEEQRSLVTKRIRDKKEPAVPSILLNTEIWTSGYDSDG